MGHLMQSCERVKPMILVGICLGFLGCISSANDGDQELFVSSIWSAVSAAIPTELQWPTVMLHLGEKLPSFMMEKTRLNPACLVGRVIQESNQNLTGERLPWPRGKRAKIMYEIARSYNQEVWMGTRHREFLKTRTHHGDIEVSTSLSVVRCEKSGSKASMFATIEASENDVPWLIAEDIPCGTVRMPSWLFTKKPLDAEQRRIRQGVGSLKNDRMGLKAGVEFISSWYSPFASSKQVANSEGWTENKEPLMETKERPVSNDYERKTMLDSQDGTIVDAGVNQIGLTWDSSANSANSANYLETMDVEACLDRYESEVCLEKSSLVRDRRHYPFSYLPWLDRWTFTPSDLKDSCAGQLQQTTFSKCSSLGSEAWMLSGTEIRELVRGTKLANRTGVDMSKYEAFLETCPSSLVLTPANVSNILLTTPFTLVMNHAGFARSVAKDMQLLIEDRIRKDGMKKISTSTLFITLVTGIQGLLAAASWEITLTAAKLVVSFLSKKDFEWKIKYVKMLSVFGSATFVTLATLPIAFLLREELRKVNNVRGDGDISPLYKRSYEGEVTDMSVFVIAMEVRDVSSRWVECTIILCAIVVAGFIILVKRVWSLSTLHGSFRKAFVLVEAVEH